MSKRFPPKIVIPLVLLLATAFVGCTHQKTNRGHLIRGDWAVEYNRTPWIGCPPDSGYEESENSTSNGGLFACLAKDKDPKNRKGFRRHCAINRECTHNNPCCRTLGCGMWVEPDDSAGSATLEGPPKVCGLTPFCFPQTPCRLTPTCGRPANTNIHPQTLAVMGSNPAMSGGMTTIRGMNPGGSIINGGIPQAGVLSGGMVNGGMVSGGMVNGGLVNGRMVNGAMVPGGIPNAGMVPGTTTSGMVGAVPGSLVSRGIVPGASAITSGGMVAAIGVATPAGTMTPSGVRLPNGAVNNAIVLRACTMTPNCTSAHPCGLTPHCGGAVAVNLVANNAIALASALQAQGIASGVMQAGGMGMLVNPMTNQPINGLTMSGYPQAGYPPIGYAPTGYAPGYPRYAAGMTDTGEPDAEEEMYVEMEEAAQPQTRSQMPVPRFHPIPSKPAFQRGEGMPSTPSQQRTTTMSEQQSFSEAELEMALDQAYLEGVSAAMDDVERKLEAKRRAAAQVKLQEKILQQEAFLQQQLDEQEELRMLAIQRDRLLRQQQAAQQQAMQQQMAQQAAEIPEPRRLAAQQNPPRSPTVAPANAANYANMNNANVNPVQLAESFKTSVGGVFGPLWGTNQRVQSPPVPPQPRTQSVPKPRQELATVSAPPDLPGRPPVAPVPMGYGLLPDDEPGPLILQAQFTADGEPLMP